MIQPKQYTKSGRVSNPVKHFYLRLVQEVVNELNNRTEGDMSLARKFMIIRGLIPGANGIWEKEQLTEELQKVVDENLVFFNGQDPSL